MHREPFRCCAGVVRPRQPAKIVSIGLCATSPAIAARMERAVTLLDGIGVQLPMATAGGKAWRQAIYDAVLAEYAGPAHGCGDIARLRALMGERPLLVIARSGAAMDRIGALAAGADDAVASHVGAREIAARIEALLRRRLLSRGVLTCDELSIDLIHRAVHRADRSIAMPLREFELLAMLARSRDRVVSRAELRRGIWRTDFDLGTNSIEVHVSRLGKRIDAGHAHAMLRTVKGEGYALVSRGGAACFAIG